MKKLCLFFALLLLASSLSASVVTIPNKAHGVNGTFDSATTDWVNGGSLAAIDTNTTAPGKLYILGDGGNDYASLPIYGTLNPGQTYYVRVKARRSAGAETTIGIGYFSGGYQMTFTPTTSEATYEGSFIAYDSYIRIGAPSPGFSGVSFELDDLEVYGGGYSKPAIHSTLEKGLVGWWPLSETWGVKDRSASGNNGTATALTYTTDRLGMADRAASFNGTSSRFDVSPSLTALKTFTAYSVGFWIYSTGASSIYVFTVGDTDGTDRLMLSHLNTNYIAFYTYYGGGTVVSFSSLSTASRNAWHKIVLTQTGALLSIYIDGQLSNTLASAFNFSNLTNADNLGFGSLKYNNTEIGFYAGKQQHHVFWNRALTPDEILEDYRRYQ